MHPLLDSGLKDALSTTTNDPSPVYHATHTILSDRYEAEMQAWCLNPIHDCDESVHSSDGEYLVADWNRHG